MKEGFGLLTVLFFILWLAFNGRFTVEVTLFGVAISFGLALFVRKYVLRGLSMKKELQILQKTPLFLRYVWLLIKEIVLANKAVLKLILSSRFQVQPKLAVFQSSLKKRSSRVTLADCITLTPGTITVSLEKNSYVVHCLDESFEDGLENSSFEQRLKDIEAIGRKEEKA